jgi:hypothetical protein
VIADPIYAGYREVLAAEAGRKPEEWTFKSNPVYQQILEHVSYEQGLAYLVLASQHPRWGLRLRTLVAETALENDRLGQPVRADFPSLGIYCSPTNLRYLWHALCIWDHVEELELHQPDFLEIGGGYGGLALWMHRLAPKAIGSYRIADLLEASAIQKAYAAELGVPLRTMGFPWARDGTFLISAYAFSEFSPEARTWHQKAVVKYCDHGWLAWNMIPVYPFTDKPLTIEDEQPLTGAGNKIVRF